MNNHQDWKPKFDFQLAKKILEAYGLKEVQLTHPEDQEEPVIIDFRGIDGEPRHLCLRETTCNIFYNRGINVGGEMGHSWIHTLVKTLQESYPPSICQ